MPDATEATAEELERQQELELARQQERVKPPPTALSATGATTTKNDDEGKSIIQKMAEKTPILGRLVGAFPVLVWILLTFKSAIMNPVGIIVAIILLPGVWAILSFLSLIGLRGVQIPMLGVLPTKLPKTNIAELMLAAVLCLFEIGIIVAILQWAQENPTKAFLIKTFTPF